jgi:hypothetical protein
MRMGDAKEHIAKAGPSPSTVVNFGEFWMLWGHLFGTFHDRPKGVVAGKSACWIAAFRGTASACCAGLFKTARRRG